MKRVMIALILLAVIVGSEVYTLGRLSRVKTDLTLQLDQIEEQGTADESETCVKMTEEFVRRVRKETGWMSWWFHQNTLNELTQSSLLLNVYAADGSREDFLAQISQCRQALNHLWQAEYPSWSAIF